MISNSQKAELKRKKLDKINRKVFVFILDIIEYCEKLNHQNKQQLGDHLINTATSWGESIHEARQIHNPENLLPELDKILSGANKIMYTLQLCQFSCISSGFYELKEVLSGISSEIKNFMQDLSIELKNKQT